MWRIVVLSIVQSAMLASAQVFLKFALARMLPFEWTRRFWASVLLNWQFAATGVLFASSSVLWMYIVKHYPLSVAYPMISISYVFGMLAAIVFFHEDVAAYKWIGIGLIMAGCCIIAK